MKHRFRFPASVATILLVVVLSTCLVGCETLKNVWSRPQTQAGVEGLTQAVFSFASAAAAESVRQLADTGKIEPNKVAIVGGAAALWTAASYLRQLHSTPAVMDPAATANQLVAAGIPPGEALPLACAITSNAELLVAQGLSQDAASEVTASAFDAAARVIQEGAKK
jgi:hypothetical protein